MGRSRFFPAIILLAMLSPIQAAAAQLGKGHRILIQRGLQLQGMATRDDLFHLSTCSNANYTSINWLWAAQPSHLGPPPGFPWSRWVANETNMPPQGEELPYLKQLVSLQLADEWPLNDPAVRDRAVNWFNAVRAHWPNVILYANNYGGQANDAALGDFIARAQPDLLCFDVYPWKNDYTTHAPIGGPPTSWYSELRRYREWARKSGIPFGTYRQTFHAIQDYDRTEYRDPSPSELRLNTFAALAFNAKVLIDFTYNTGASSLFKQSAGGDNAPTPLYAEQAEINHRARNLGKALVRLQPIEDLHNPGAANPPPGPASAHPHFPDHITTGILFLRGKHPGGGGTNLTALPMSFAPGPAPAIPYSWWEFGKNDPYLAGWVVTNQAGVNNHGLEGDVIIAWFKPLDESFDGPKFTDEVYLMIVNGLTACDGTAADCRQEIKLNFLDTPATRRVVMLNSDTGRLETNALPVVSTRRQLTLELNGGDAALFKFDTGAPFVGF
jgi:hypothetical protein